MCLRNELFLVRSLQGTLSTLCLYLVFAKSCPQQFKGQYRILHSFYDMSLSYLNIFGYFFPHCLSVV